MKAILLSIQPKHLVNILNGKKTLEIRKSVPKNFKGWVYLYCTKSKLKLLFDYLKKVFFLDKLKIKNDFILNGKIVARFWFDEYEIVNYRMCISPYGYTDDFEFKISSETLKKTCLSYDELEKYGNAENDIVKPLYVWHIKNLEIFDKPKELSEFHKIGYHDSMSFWEYERADGCNAPCPAFVYEIKKAPQSWMYVEVDI